MNTFVEQHKCVDLLEPQTGATIGASDYISLKNATKCTLQIKEGAGHSATCVVSVKEATAVAGTSAATITETFPIWSNKDTATSDTLVRRTDAANYTTNAASTNELIYFEIDPVILSDGFDCICVNLGNSNAGNLFEVTAFIEYKYKGDAAPAAITD